VKSSCTLRPRVEDLALGRLDEAREHFDGSTLPRPVGSEIAEDFTGTDGEADGADGGGVVVIFGEGAGFEHLSMDSYILGERGCQGGGSILCKRLCECRPMVAEFSFTRGCLESCQALRAALPRDSQGGGSPLTSGSRRTMRPSAVCLPRSVLSAWGNESVLLTAPVARPWTGYAASGKEQNLAIAALAKSPMSPYSIGHHDHLNLGLDRLDGPCVLTHSNLGDD